MGLDEIRRNSPLSLHVRYIFISIPRIKLYHSPNSSITPRRSDVIFLVEASHGFDNKQTRKSKIGWDISQSHLEGS